MDTRRSVAAVLALVAVAVSAAALAGFAPTALAHGNHVTIPDQVVSDGRITVGTVSTSTDAHLTIRTDDGGEPGRVVGHVPVETGYRTGLVVPLDDAFWADRSGEVQLWAVLHEDTGGAAFDPEEDPPLAESPTSSRPVEWSFVVRKADAGSTVIVGGASRLTASAVSIERVALAGSGHVAVRAVDPSGEVGRVVGSTRLDAGTYANVVVDIGDEFYDSKVGQRSFPVAVQVYTGTGDSFDPAATTPVTVDGDPIESSVFVSIQPAYDPNGTDPVTETADPIDPTPPATPDRSSTAGTPTDTGADDGGSGALSLPGFGVVVAVLALAVAALLAGRD
ncbi:hypothetical protein BRD17_06970 [Halobacteriales archaeon SW_7_68_16]|nr:MAG: hypothetical protein BRD17_06970 [Halobacteriales archaeon SW_7_68_16]